MIVNNLEHDVRMQCVKSDKTQVQIAEEIGTSPQYVNRVIKKQNGVINQTFVQIWEALGYDVKLTYVKKQRSDLCSGSKRGRTGSDLQEERKNG